MYSKNLLINLGVICVNVLIVANDFDLDLEEAIEKGLGIIHKCKEDLVVIQNKIEEINPEVVFIQMTCILDNFEQIRDYFLEIHTSLVVLINQRDIPRKVFKIRAFDYITSPYTKESVMYCIDRISIYLSNYEKTSKSISTCKKYIIKSNGIINLVPSQDILYFASGDKKTLVYSKNRIKPFIIKETLKEIESKLVDNYNFLRTHKSFIVNTAHIKKIEPSGQTHILYFDDSASSSQVYLSKKFAKLFFSSLPFHSL